MPRSWPVSCRRARLVNPSRWVRKVSNAENRAWLRGFPIGSPGTRLPCAVSTGSVTSWRAAVPAIGSWSSRWTPSRRRLAEKPIFRSADRFTRPFRKAEVAGVVDGGLGPKCSSFLVVLLHGGVFVLGVQRRSDAVGDHPGPEQGRGGPFPTVVDAPVEDQPDLIGAADVEVVADDVFEEDPASQGGVEHLGQR